MMEIPADAVLVEPVLEEYPMTPGLAARIDGYQRRVAKAQAELDEAVAIALEAMGVDGQIQVTILENPPRFRITRPEAT